MGQQMLRPFWSRLFSFNWRFGLVLIFGVCIPRFAMVVNANITGNYGSIAIVMILSAIIPFLFLSKTGRKKIGLQRPKNYSGVLLSFMGGLFISSIIFYLGYVLYADSISNWYVYIGRSYNLPQELGADDKLIFFIIFAATGMIFSPIGEELFFRGIVHASFSASFGERKASVIDSLAFALTHLAHFGIVYHSGSWQFLPIPALLWVSSMFATSLLFIVCLKKTGSLLGAIASHAGFNLAMTYFIFYHL